MRYRLNTATVAPGDTWPENAPTKTDITRAYPSVIVHTRVLTTGADKGSLEVWWVDPIREES